MAATANRLPRVRKGLEFSHPVKTGVHIYSGVLVAVDATGYALPAADTAAHRVIGYSTEEQDNTDGASGDLSILVRLDVLELENSESNPVTNAYIGRRVFVEDDITVSIDDGTNAIVAGTCRGIDQDSGKVWVDIATQGQRGPSTLAQESTNGTAAAAADLAALKAETEKLSDDLRAVVTVLKAHGIVAV